MADSNITKRALAAALKELMEGKAFCKISISDICEKCEMNRKSFYYHFRDKYDLVNWIFDTEFLQSIRPENYTAGWQLLEDMYTYFYEEKEFYRCAMRIEGQNSFREYFCEAITPLISFFSKDVFDGVENADFYITFFSDAILMSLIRWLTEGVQIHPKEYLEQLREIAVRLARLTLEKLGGQ